MKHKNPAGCDETAGYDEAALPAKFIAVCVFAFVAGVLTTAYFCRSMSGGMEMPGGWTMSMMWMRMDGQSWFASAIDFLLMWLAMMVAMMLPAALPMFLKTRRQWASLCYMASGYFVIWLAAGVGIYVLGVVFMEIAMRSELLSQAAAPMTIQLTLGIMNPLVMIVVAIVIAAEKLLPRPGITVRLVGFAAILAGITTIL